MSGVLFLLYVSLMMNNIFYMWMLLEFVFFFVIFCLIKDSKSKSNLSGVIFYLFIQALGSVLLLSSVMVEMFYYGNYYYFNSNICLGCLYLSVMGVLLKMGVFPFYLQVYQIMSFISFRQILMFMLYPKVVPVVMLYNMLGQLDLESEMLVFPILVAFVSSVQSLKASDLRELLAWSSLSQLAWIFVSVLGSLFSFLSFFLMYVVLLTCFCSLVEKGSSKLFYDFFNLSGSSYESYYYVLFLIFFMSSLAPFFMFYMKLFLLFSVSNFFLSYLFLLLLSSMSMFLFYMRVIQVVTCIGNTFFYVLPLEMFFQKSYFLYIMFFFFCFGSFLFLL